MDNKWTDVNYTDNKLNADEVLKLIRLENRSRHQEAALQAHIAQGWLDYTTTLSHFELVCSYINLTSETKNLEYKKTKTLGGVFFEDIYDEDEETKANIGQRAHDWIVNTIYKLSGIRLAR